jgi:hypothetical protein
MILPRLGSRVWPSVFDFVHSVDVHESEGAVSHTVEEGENHSESASSSESLLVKLIAASSWTYRPMIRAVRVASVRGTKRAWMIIWSAVLSG